MYMRHLRHDVAGFQTHSHNVQYNALRYMLICLILNLCAIDLIFIEHIISFYEHVHHILSSYLSTYMYDYVTIRVY